MYKLEKSIFIDRSPQDVFEYISNPAYSREWQSGVVSSEIITDGPQGVGSVWSVRMKLMGREIQTNTEVTSWDPPNRLSFKASNGPIPAQITNTFTPKDGGTLLITETQAELGGFFKLAEGMVGKQLEKQVENDLKTAKSMLEAGKANK